MTTARTARRSGAETRREAQRVALDLFTRQGYETTSLRDIAAELGINKASLYYHFDSKQAILASLFDDRGTEAADLLAWLETQPADSRLVERTVLRWVDTFSADKLRGIRFLAANPRLGGAVSGGTDGGIAAGLTRLADRLAQHLPAPDAEHRLVLRMALLSINAAVFAAAEAGFSDDEIVRSAHRAARALAREATSPGPD